MWEGAACIGLEGVAGVVRPPSMPWSIFVDMQLITINGPRLAIMVGPMLMFCLISNALNPLRAQETVTITAMTGRYR